MFCRNQRDPFPGFEGLQSISRQEKKKQSGTCSLEKWSLETRHTQYCPPLYLCSFIFSSCRPLWRKDQIHVNLPHANPQPFSARFAWHCFPLQQHFITCGWVPSKLNIILLCLEGGQRTFTKWRHEEDAFCLWGFGDFSSPSWRCSFGAKLCLPSGTDECAVVVKTHQIWVFSPLGDRFMALN